MKDLLNYQRSFYKAIFTNNFSMLEKYFNCEKDLRERFNIYSNNIFTSLKTGLRNDFPFCEKLLGEKKFNQISFEFVRNFPPTSGCLLNYGDKFSSFLGASFLELPYIRDIAQLEWAKKELYYKENTYPLVLNTLNSISAEKYPALIFDFPKAVFLFKSDFSLRKIWEGTKDKQEPIKCPNRAPSFCLLIRPRYQVQHYWLREEEFIFFEMLYHQKTLGEAYEKAAVIKPDFNLDKTLKQAFTREYFTKATLL